MRVAVPILIFALVACGGNEPQQTAQQQPVTPVAGVSAAPSLTPEQLGELGARIQKEPARANELLSEKGLTHESFEKAIRDVTENPEASKRYAAAYKRTSA